MLYWHFYFILAFNICRFCMVIRFFHIPDFIHYIFVLSLFFRKRQYFHFLMLSAKQGNYWYHFYNVGWHDFFDIFIFLFKA